VRLVPAGASAAVALLGVVLYGVVLPVAGCVAPSAEFDRTAAALGLRRETIEGAGFRHALIRNRGRSTGTLHVYLDGDGSPWIAGRPTTDPTPRDPLLLRLMAADPAEAVYLGRPCYAGMAADPACVSRLWTRERYGPEVVGSMRAAIRRAAPGRPIGWIGHSGGGTLALLLAARVEETRFVLTIAADFDPPLWGHEVTHDSLDGSLSPTEAPPLTPAIRQLHLAGAEDRIVPPALMASATTRLGLTIEIVPGFDHACCWERSWPAALARIDPSAQKAQFTPTMPP
jgi:pimeloyl-ACP methyl ester carboxylesterase